jgi:hypothetical protein
MALSMAVFAAVENLGETVASHEAECLLAVGRDRQLVVWEMEVGVVLVEMMRKFVIRSLPLLCVGSELRQSEPLTCLLIWKTVELPSVCPLLLNRELHQQRLDA